MKMYKILASILVAVFILNHQQARAGDAKKKCLVNMETTAYLDYKEPVISGRNVGKIYQSHMESIVALEKNGDFKNFKIVTQMMDIQPSNDNSEIRSLMMKVSLTFDLNYDAVSYLYSKFKNSGISISTNEVRKCQ